LQKNLAFQALLSLPETMRIRAFQGLRPDVEVAVEVASLPYDVVSTEEARALGEMNPKSFLHIVRAEIDLPQKTDPYSEHVYVQAKENFEKFRSNNWLVREDAPCLYVYQQRLNEHRQTGLVTVCHIDDYECNIIRKHEKTRQQKEDDRTALNRSLNAHPGPVFLTYPEQAHIDAAIAAICEETPLFDFTAPDRVQHTVWKVTEFAGFIAEFANIPCCYVADGHHRSASAARIAKEKRVANPDHTSHEDYNWFLAVLFPQNQLNILPYNRHILDLNGLSAHDFLSRIKTVCTVTEGADACPDAAGNVAMYLAGKWYGLRFNSAASADPVANLDVSHLQNRILGPILGIDDPRTDDRIDFVGGIRGTRELEKRVQEFPGSVAFSMFPVTCQQLMAIADADQIMPPKSTWFEPKLRSGLFVHTL